jgi:hypothetical protein
MVQAASEVPYYNELTVGLVGTGRWSLAIRRLRRNGRGGAWGRSCCGQPDKRDAGYLG